MFRFFPSTFITQDGKLTIDVTKHKHLPVLLLHVNKPDIFLTKNKNALHKFVSDVDFVDLCSSYLTAYDQIYIKKYI